MTQRPRSSFERWLARPWVRRARTIFFGVVLVLHAMLITILCWNAPARHEIIFLVWVFCALGILLLIRGWRGNYIETLKKGGENN
jgi:hypothetical protein